jgi:pyruvate dehydrogenase (quinone)
MNNRDLNMVSWEQRVLEGDPKFPESQDVPAFSYAEYAKLVGFTGLTIDEPGKIVPMLEQALQSPTPVLIDVLTDPNVPPLPPHVSAKQARNYLAAIAKGDPDALKIVRASIRELFA